MKGIQYLFATILLTATITFASCKSPDVPRDIPEFSMRLADTTKVFHSRDIPFGKTSMIIYFDPACRECQQETEYILANMKQFAHVDIYMVTRHSHADLMVFYNHLRLDTCKNLKIGIDNSGAIPRAFKENMTPLTMIYNEDKFLTAFFKGKAKPANLLSVINKKG